MGYQARDLPFDLASWCRNRYRLWRFMRWNGAGRVRAIVWDLAPTKIAHKVRPVADCGNHQWHSDLTLLRYWTPDEDKWFTYFFEKLAPQDRCLYCRATRAVPGTTSA